MPNPSPGDVHVNTPLTNISIAFLQDQKNFVASKVFPNIPVSKQSDRYYTYDRGEFNRDEARLRAPGTESAGGSYELDNTPSYFANTYAFHKDVPDQVRANADAVLNPDREATEYVMHKLMIRREKVWSNRYFQSGVWGTDNAAATWQNYASGSNPIQEIRTGRRIVAQSTGYNPNTIVMGRQTYDTLADHPDIIERVNAGQTNGAAMGTMMAMMDLFETERIFVMNGIENTATEGQDATHSFIGGDNLLICYSAPNPGLMTPSAGYTFSWTGMAGNGPEGNRIKRFRREEYESDRVEGQMSFDTKLIAADLGYFFSNPTTA